MEQHEAKQPGKWRKKMIQRTWPFSNMPLRPADVSNELLSLMLARQNVLEDVNYSKIVPNYFIVEVPADVYVRDFEPIRGQVLRQWNERILRRLMTANSRLGRREYRFAGRVRVEMRPENELEPFQVRVVYAIHPDESAAPGAAVQVVSCLESLAGGRRYPLAAAVVTLGRDAICEIVLDAPAVQQARLVSGRHAHIRQESGRWLIFDGAPYGRPSLNGTFVNGRAVAPQGHALQNGDIVILASLDPAAPRAETPGVAAFRFLSDCS